MKALVVTTPKCQRNVRYIRIGEKVFDETFDEEGESNFPVLVDALTAAGILVEYQGMEYPVRSLTQLKHSRSHQAKMWNSYWQNYYKMMSIFPSQHTLITNIGLDIERMKE